MINEAFQKLKSNLNFNPGFDQTIQQKHNAVRSVVENINPAFKTKLIGSLQRKTRIQPRPGNTFDIDILVIMGSFTDWVSFGGVSPDQALNTLEETVSSSARYDAMNPTQDQPTVTFEYKDKVKVELVPAYLDMIGRSPEGLSHSPVGRAYWIPKDGRWVLADYDHDANYVSATNQALGGWLVPTIKMLKAARRIHFPDLGTFHLETIAADLIPAIIQYNNTNGIVTTYPGLIKDFFTYSHNHLNQPMKIPGSHTPHVSVEEFHKPAVAQKFKDIQEHCESIVATQSETAQKAAWRILFGEPFPS